MSKHKEILQLTEIELKAWLNNDTTLKIVELIKIFRQQNIEALIANPNAFEDKSVILGLCQGFQSLIDLIEKPRQNEEDFNEFLKEYINLQTENYEQ